MRLWIVTGGIVLACFGIIFGLSIILGGCTTMIQCISGEVPMKCHWSFVAVQMISIVGIVVSFASLFCKQKEGRRMGAFSSFVLLLLIILTPTPIGIGICANPEMHCHVTANFIWVVAGLAVILTIIQLVKADPKKAELPKMQL